MRCSLHGRNSSIGRTDAKAAARSDRTPEVSGFVSAVDFTPTRWRAGRGCRGSRGRGRGRSLCGRGRPGPAPRPARHAGRRRRHRPAAASGDANQPTAAAASIAAPSAAASLTGETESGRSSTRGHDLHQQRANWCRRRRRSSAPTCRRSGLPSPRVAIACSNAMPSRTARKRCAGRVVERQADDRAARGAVPIGAHHAGPVGHDQQAVAAGSDHRPPPSRAAAAEADPVVRTIQSTSCMPERSTVSSMKPDPAGATSVRNASERVTAAGIGAADDAGAEREIRSCLPRRRPCRGPSPGRRRRRRRRAARPAGRSAAAALSVRPPQIAPGANKLGQLLRLQARRPRRAPDARRRSRRRAGRADRRLPCW